MNSQASAKEQARGAGGGMGWESGREDDYTQLKCTLLMKCHKGMMGYSREALCDKLILSPRTIGGLLGEIPDRIDMSKGSLLFERYMTHRHGYKIENKGGFSYTTAKRKLALFRIICLGHSQV
jgi:hypothetical protein